MKSRKTNLDSLDQGADNPELQGVMLKRPQKPDIRLGREAQARIGDLLRSMYNTYVNQGVPPQLEDLVRRLGEQE